MGAHSPLLAALLAALLLATSCTAGRVLVEQQDVDSTDAGEQARLAAVGCPLLRHRRHRTTHLCNPCSQLLSVPPAPADVIVVGAGMSGITLARNLTDAGELDVMQRCRSPLPLELPCLEPGGV